ncbi:MAG: hypothetical protein E7376_01920 [Clostridiales bacterium]|nr:hypothetical protein [Clostridiales bacterium]
MKLLTENEYFEILDKLIQERNNKLYAHFGRHFLEGYTNIEERDWYEQNIGNLDKDIIKYTNELTVLLGIDKHMNKIADVFKNRTITAWYNKRKIEKNKKLGSQR